MYLTRVIQEGVGVVVRGQGRSQNIPDLKGLSCGQQPGGRGVAP